MVLMRLVQNGFSLMSFLKDAIDYLSSVLIIQIHNCPAVCLLEKQPGNVKQKKKWCLITSAFSGSNIDKGMDWKYRNGTLLVFYLDIFVEICSHFDIKGFISIEVQKKATKD